MAHLEAFSPLACFHLAHGSRQRCVHFLVRIVRTSDRFASFLFFLRLDIPLSQTLCHALRRPSWKNLDWEFQLAAQLGSTIRSGNFNAGPRSRFYSNDKDSSWSNDADSIPRADYWNAIVCKHIFSRLRTRCLAKSSWLHIRYYQHVWYNNGRSRKLCSGNTSRYLGINDADVLYLSWVVHICFCVLDVYYGWPKASHLTKPWCLWQSHSLKCNVIYFFPIYGWAPWVVLRIICAAKYRTKKHRSYPYW